MHKKLRTVLDLLTNFGTYNYSVKINTKKFPRRYTFHHFTVIASD